MCKSNSDFACIGYMVDLYSCRNRMPNGWHPHVMQLRLKESSGRCQCCLRRGDNWTIVHHSQMFGIVHFGCMLCGIQRKMNFCCTRMWWSQRFITLTCLSMWQTTWKRSISQISPVLTLSTVGDRWDENGTEQFNSIGRLKLAAWTREVNIRIEIDLRLR